jgi:hypothetical protein
VHVHLFREQHFRHNRHQRPRQQIRRKHGENDGQRQRRE